MTFPSVSLIASAMTNSANIFRGDQITFSFPGAGATWPGYNYGSEPTLPQYEPLSALQATAARQAFFEWASLIAMPIVEVPDPGIIRVAFTEVGKFGGAGFWGYTYDPPNSLATATPRQGDIWIDSKYSDSEFLPYSFDYMALMHEIGHTLGLIDFMHRASGISDYAHHKYTIMAYDFAIYDQLLVAVKVGLGVSLTEVNTLPSTPMVLDISAVQSLFGRNTITNSGDTIYHFDQ